MKFPMLNRDMAKEDDRILLSYTSDGTSVMLFEATLVEWSRENRAKITNHYTKETRWFHPEELPYFVEKLPKVKP